MPLGADTAPLEIHQLSNKNPSVRHRKPPFKSLVEPKPQTTSPSAIALNASQDLKESS